MKSNQKGNVVTIVSIVLVLLVVVLVGAYVIFADDAEPAQQTIQTDPETGETLPAGSYVDYNMSAVAEAGDDTKVIFFWAGWCPECLSFERNLKAAPIPDGLTILKANYDKETDLKRKYGITHQTSFVQVDAEGNQITKWQGFGSDDVDTVLQKVVKEN